MNGFANKYRKEMFWELNHSDHFKGESVKIISKLQD